jgi:hypothetical protein
MSLRWTGTLLALCLAAPTPGFSHPMGNFSISHYSRFTFGPQSIDLLYLIDMAEIPAFQEKPLVDANGNGTVEPSEQDAYLSRKVGELTEGLVVKLNGAHYALVRTSQQLELLPGGLNLPTLKIALNYRLALKAEQLKELNLLDYQDTNFPGRAGWKEIIVQGEGIVESSVSDVDKSQQLMRYPEDPAIKPPEDLVAQVRFRQNSEMRGSASASRSASAADKSRNWIIPGSLWVGSLVVCAAVGSFLAWRWFSGKKGA